MSETPKVVVWGSDNYNTLGVLRSLGKSGFDVLMLVKGNKKGVATASKYCKRVHYSPSIEEGVDFLMANYPEEDNPRKRAVMIPGGDATSLASAKYYDVLFKRFHLMCTRNPATLIEVTDKNVMGRIAEQAGILVPISQEFHKDVTDIRVPFPAILKPVHVEGRVELKTKLFQTKEELLKFAKFFNPKNIYILQQFVKKSHDIYIYGCKLPNGELVLAGRHMLERWSDDGGGSYGKIYPDIPPYIDVKALNRFLDKIGYQGEFSAEYGLEKDKAYFYEVNMRNDGYCHYSYQAGANLPLLWVCSCLGLPFNGNYEITKPMICINEILDIVNVWKGKISWKRYKKDLHEAEGFLYYDESDLKPYKNRHRNMWWEIPFRALLKTFRPQIVWILKKIGK